MIKDREIEIVYTTIEKYKTINETKNRLHAIETKIKKLLKFRTKY